MRIPRRAILLIPSLGRENGNEVIATARAIGAALRAEGMDFHDLARALDIQIASNSTPQRSSTPPERGAATWAPGRTPCFGDLARACRDLDRGRLTPHERAFVADMVRRGFGFRPTPRQAQWLADIFNRLNAGRAAA